jgi:hypothetical protein
MRSEAVRQADSLTWDIVTTGLRWGLAGVLVASVLVWPWSLWAAHRGLERDRLFAQMSGIAPRYEGPKPV